ncbi:MAG: argininosuccinate lyase [Pyrinomonadaceae bacterium]
MKKYNRYFGLMAASAFLLLLFTASSFAQATQDFTLHNETGKTIKEVYVAPTASNDWGDDVLGADDTLGDGEDVDIVFNRRNKVNNYDLQVTFSDGKSSIWTKFDLSTISDITISYKNGKPWATWK